MKRRRPAGTMRQIRRQEQAQEPMPDFIEEAALWLADDDSAYAESPDYARRAAAGMLAPALAEIERLRAEIDLLRSEKDLLLDTLMAVMLGDTGLSGGIGK